MEFPLISALILAVGIGLSLGLLGSGGSIVTLPVLVSVAGVPVAAAVGMSLAIVGGRSVAGAWLKHRQGLVHWRAVALFGGAGMAGSLMGAQFTRLVSPGVLLLFFAALMAVVAGRMLVRGGDEAIEPLPDCRPASGWAERFSPRPCGVHSVGSCWGLSDFCWRKTGRR